MTSFITYLLLAVITGIAAIAKATADALFSHPNTFPLKGKFWQISEGYIIPYTKYKVNAWHVANSIMICALLLPVWIAYGMIPYIVSGVIFNLTFNIFYNKILVKK